MRIPQTSDQRTAVLGIGGLIVFLVVIAMLKAPAVRADHDGLDQQWRRQLLDACELAWDPSDQTVIAHDGQTLADQTGDVVAIFREVWNDFADPRWRWEHDCTHAIDANAHNHTVFAHSHEHEGAHSHGNDPYGAIFHIGTQSSASSSASNCEKTPSYVRGHDHNGERRGPNGEQLSVEEFRAYLTALGWDEWCRDSNDRWGVNPTFVTCHRTEDGEWECPR